MGLRVGLDGFDPLQKRDHLAAHQETAAVLFHQTRGALAVVCQKRMMDGILREAMLLVPG